MSKEIEQQSPRLSDASKWQAALISNRRRWFLVILLFVASTINYLDRATLSVALPQISGELLLAPAAKGLLLSAFFWSYALMQLPMGWIADRFDLRWLYAGLFALWSMACGLTGLAGGLAMMIFLRILLGVGESIYLPGSVRFVSMTFPPEERGFPSGLFDCGTRAGLAIGAPLVAWLVSRYGWRNMFFIVGFTALVWIAPWLAVFPRGFSRGMHTESKAAPAVQSLKRLTFNRNLVGACLGFFTFGYYGYLLVTWLPDYLVEVRHMTILKAGMLSSLPYLVWTLAEPTGGWLADRLVHFGWTQTRARKTVIAIGFSTGLLMIPAAFVSGLTACMFLLGGASMAGLAGANQLVVFQSCAPPDEVGRWMGMGNFIGNLGGVLSPLVTGLLISSTGSYAPGFVLASIILLAGIFAYGLIVGEMKPPMKPV